MTEQQTKQKYITIKDLQSDKYIQLPGKFYCCNAINKNFNFYDYKTFQPKQQNTFITLQKSNKDSSLINDTLYSRIQNENGLSQQSTQGVLDNSAALLPKINFRHKELNKEKMEDKNQNVIKRNNSQFTLDSNPDQFKYYMRNEYQTKKVEVSHRKQHSHDFSLPYRVQVNGDGNIEKKETKDNLHNLTKNLSFKNNTKYPLQSNSTSIWMNSPNMTQMDSQQNEIDITEIFKNSQQKQIKISTDTADNSTFLNSTFLKTQTSKSHKFSYENNQRKGSYDSILTDYNNIPLVSYNSFLKKSNGIKQLNVDIPIVQNLSTEPDDQKKQQFQIRKNNSFNKKSKNYVFKTEGNENKCSLNDYLIYLKQNNNMLKAYTNLKNMSDNKRSEKNVEDHMAKVEEILQDTNNEENEMKVKLRKIAQNIAKAKKFQNQMELLTHMKKDRGSVQRKQYIQDLEKFNNQLSKDHSIFIKEFYYSVQEFIDLLKSNKRASLMIQFIRGFNPVIKQILFLDDEIRKDLSIDVMEKSIVSVMQFYQIKKEQKNKDNSPQKAKAHSRRKGVWFELSDESVKELQFFYKNLRECVDQKNSDKKISIQTEFDQNLNQIEQVLQKYILDPNQDKVKIKDQCFQELKFGQEEELPYFVQNNKPLSSLKYWEKHIGKFDLVSEYVRDKDQQITNICKIYQSVQ